MIDMKQGLILRRLMAVVVCSLMAMSGVWAERVSENNAALVANHFMNGVSAGSGAKKAPARRMVRQQAETEVHYFIFENANGEGWVLVAGDDAAHPVLAYSPTGHFRTENQPDHLKAWLENYDLQIRTASEQGLEADEAVRAEWEGLLKSPQVKMADEIVAPLIKTGWNQREPYWNFCPTINGQRCLTGCVATAMAQVMNYYRWPKQGTGSHTTYVDNNPYTVDFGQATYDWNNMLNTYDAGYNDAQANAVATLMYHCGVAVDMQYGTGSSGAFTISYNGYLVNQYGEPAMCAETALKTFFGYKSSVRGYLRDGYYDIMRSWSDGEWMALLKRELDAHRPIMYAGHDPNGGGGHSFICDGYDSENKFHFNWGWGNYCDGYYNINNLVPTDGHSYTAGHDVIVGIEPEGEYGYSLLVNDTKTIQLKRAGDFEGYQQWYTDAASLKANDVVKVLNNETNISWAIGILNPASSNHVTNTASGLVVDKDGTYTMYLKLKFEADEIYVAPLPDEDEDPEELPEVYLAGDMNGWNATANKFDPAEDERTASLTISLEKKKYEFKIVSNGKWLGTYGDDGLYRVHRDWPLVEKFDKVNTDNTNIELKADVAGDYMFTWNYAEKSLYVTYPDKSQVAYRLRDGYYLIGSKQSWSVDNVTSDLLFMTNEYADGEFMLKADLVSGDEIKVAWVEEDEVVKWYPEGDNYVITSKTEGKKIIYFRPVWHEDWKGHIYIEPNEVTAVENTSTEIEAVKSIDGGQFYIRKNGVLYNAQGTVISK